MQKPKIKLAPVGFVYHFNQKQGGGSYTVIAHVPCMRCETVIEERKWERPTAHHKKQGYYYAQSKWCGCCGLYEPAIGSRVVIKKKK